MIHDMHNDAVLWEKYYHRTLPRLSRFRCWFHLLFCKRCRGQLRRLKEDNELIAELRTALNAMSVPENPAEYLRLCELFEKEGTKEE
jgi:hypothetical protein